MDIPDREMKIKAVQKSATILDALVKLDGATAEELSTYLEYPLSTTFDHLYTLEAIGNVVKRGEEYQLGSRLLELGDQMRLSSSVYTYSKPHLNKLSMETNRHASLMIEENGYGVYIYTAEGQESGPLIGSLGQKTMMHASAPGKALLAKSDPERIETILERRGLPPVTDQTITDEAKLQRTLTTIRDRGYALDNEEGIEGMYGIAAPVVDKSTNELLGAISSYTASNKDIETFENNIANKILEVKNRIELNITYS